VSETAWAVYWRVLGVFLAIIVVSVAVSVVLDALTCYQKDLTPVVGIGRVVCVKEVG
jgi:hypothetical protein